MLALLRPGRSPGHSLVQPARAELPPLIPRKILFSDPHRAVVRISPDGNMLSYLAPSDKGVANVFVEDFSTRRARMVTRAAYRRIYDYAWAFDGKHWLYFSDENGNEDFHLYSVEQSEKIVNTIREKGGKVLFVVYPDEGHGFTRPENNIDFTGRAEELLHGAIGGRFEPWQKVPGATGELK